MGHAVVLLRHHLCGGGAWACWAISPWHRRRFMSGLGATAANVIIGALSAIVDNIPLMFAVLTMDPAMSDGQWLLITLTCGVGGSMLSVGSAAGVALMGQARGLLHLHEPSEMVLGGGAGLCRRDPVPSVAERGAVLGAISPSTPDRAFQQRPARLPADPRRNTACPPTATTAWSRVPRHPESACFRPRARLP